MIAAEEERFEEADGEEGLTPQPILFHPKILCNLKSYALTPKFVKILGDHFFSLVLKVVEAWDLGAVPEGEWDDEGEGEVVYIVELSQRAGSDEVRRVAVAVDAEVGVLEDLVEVAAYLVEGDLVVEEV